MKTGLLKRPLAPAPPPECCCGVSAAGREKTRLGCGRTAGPQNVLIHFYQRSFSKIHQLCTFRISSTSGRGKGKRATPTIMCGAQSEVNYIDWWSDIKSIPFGSRLVMPVMFPPSSRTFDHYSKQAVGEPPTYFPTTGNAAVSPRGGQGFTPLPYLAAASEKWCINTGRHARPRRGTWGRLSPPETPGRFMSEVCLQPHLEVFQNQ